MNWIIGRITTLLITLLLAPASFASLLPVFLELGPGTTVLQGTLDTGDARGVEEYQDWEWDYDFHFDLFQITFSEAADVTLTVTPDPDNYFIPWVNLFAAGSIDVDPSLAATMFWLNATTGVDLYSQSEALALGYSDVPGDGSVLHPAQLSFSTVAGGVYQVVVTSYDYYSTNDPDWPAYYTGVTLEGSSYPVIAGSNYPVLGSYIHDPALDRYIYSAALGSYEFAVSSANNTPQHAFFAADLATVPEPATWLLLLAGVLGLLFHQRRVAATASASCL